MVVTDEVMFAGAACGLVLTDARGMILRINGTFCDWLGYEAGALEGTKRFQELLTVGARIFHQTHWLPLMQLQHSVAEIKLDFQHREGRKVPMLVNARTLVLADGQICHSISASVATDRDRYERELVKARASAEELLLERTQLQAEADQRSLFAEQLIGIVSHDLRNPLTAIRMGTEMLVLDDVDPKRLRLSERINQSVDRALLLVEDLLDFTLTKTGREMAMNRHDVDFHHVIATGVDELRLAFRGIAIEHRSEGEAAVSADAERLVRVLGNLVANAARYGDNRAGITVRSVIDGETARLTVENSGEPIPESLMPSLFQAMTRGSTHHGGGVGLGLYIVSVIASGHGGTTLVASDSVSGTRVGIEFPIQPATAVDTSKQPDDEIQCASSKESQ
ncbi:sigma-B regulation protein RsbU (phosphoserine phosphatase) [Pseudoxanthomonas sp. GM95]|uniref:sensor histidine kinase n=1 Tax=Pseudoxanthomonas sp. GM95 TaxID=1881043 RepID=UPI0008B3F0BE|nr:HAMP domain-containing sensor histidine kinase [Pseudoxanthomonas sp. GM95]SEL57098.1 sigma-B regulation protein RsbU (phosphoserine phosphatase) [Pseudoxanthomonas sp. GM95]